MLVLLAGVAALLKYVSDQGWLVLPIELRLAGVTVGALGLLAFGWHQRGRRRMFALALQGGAIGVLLQAARARLRAAARAGVRWHAWWRNECRARHGHGALTAPDSADGDTAAAADAAPGSAGRWRAAPVPPQE
ncbi:hypothetical protein G6F23_014851 [Rhizopus arrhizus]|nr:hypothetical protein G6F23_014851 [Rhizopus arrhizus]